MIRQLLSPRSGLAASPLLIGLRSMVSWQEVDQLARQIGEKWSWLGNSRVGLCFPASRGGLAALAAFDQLGCDVVLLDAATHDPSQLAQSCGLPLAAVVEFSADDLPQLVDRWSPADRQGARASGQRQVTLLTSGTTGVPKAVCHTWESLLRPVRRDHQSSERATWLLTYRPHLYAGLQVLLQALVRGDRLAVPAPEDGAGEIVALMNLARVNCASATPAYWRQLLIFADPRQLATVPLQQITLGGEVVDQNLLDQLHARFPQARIVHIYATTELGRCFSVTDGRAGFPTSYLNQPTRDGVSLRLAGDELEVQSANGMIGYHDRSEGSRSSVGPPPPPSAAPPWFATGDLVEVDGNRVYFKGRRSDLINVGGNKVSPASVERVIRQVSGVADVRVFGKPSSIAGQIVGCEIVAVRSTETEKLRQQISDHCRRELTSPQVPRWIEFVDRIDLSSAGKVRRDANGS